MSLDAGTAYVDILPRLSKGFAGQIEQGVTPEARRAGENAGSALGGTIKKIAVAAAGAFALDKVIDFTKGTISAASDLNETVSKATVVFGDFSDGIIELGDRAAKSLGISKQAAIENAATFGNLFVSMGIGKAQSAQLSSSLVQLASDLASFNNVSPEEALDALRSGLVGETEPLRKFGVNINDAALQAEALRLGLVKGAVDMNKVRQAQLALTDATQKQNQAAKDAHATDLDRQKAAAAVSQAEANLKAAMAGQVPQLNASAKAQAAYSLIMQQTKTAQGDFARTSGGLANQQRILAARIQDVKAKIGAALLPVMLAVTKVVSEGLGPGLATVVRVFGLLKLGFQDARIQGEGWVGVVLKIGNVVHSVITTVISVLQNLWSAFGVVVSFVKENAGPVLAALGAMILAVVVPAFVAWAAASIAAAAAEIAALAPVIAVVAAIGLLVGALVYAYDHWTAFREVVDATVSWLVGTAWPAIQAAWSAIVGAISAAVDWVTNTGWPALKAFIGFLIDGWNGLSAVTAVVWNAIAAVLQWFINNPVKFVREQIDALTQFFRRHWDEISEIITTGWNNLTAVTRAVFDALSTYLSLWWDVISGIFRTAFAVVSALWSPFWTGLQAIVHIAFDAISTIVRVAWDIIAGVFRAGRDTLLTIFGALLDLLTGHWQRAWDTIRDGIGKIWSDIGDAILGAARAALDGISTVFDDFVKWGGQLGHKLIDGIVSAIKGAAGEIGDAIRDVVKDIPGSSVLTHVPGVGSLFKAGGGPVVAGQPYIVGEKGWEWFVPDVSGTIVPHTAAAAGMPAMASGPTIVHKHYELTLQGSFGDTVDLTAEFARMERLSGP